MREEAFAGLLAGDLVRAGHRVHHQHRGEVAREGEADAVEAVEAPRGVLGVAAAPHVVGGGGAEREAQVRLLRDPDFRRGVEHHGQDVVHRRGELAELHELHAGAVADEPVDHRADEPLVLGGHRLEHPAHALPGAGRRPAALEVLALLVEEEAGAEADERRHDGQDAVAQGPGDPALGVLAQLHVQEAVREGGGHRRGDGAVAGAVAGGADVPAVGDAVELAEAAVEDELVGGDLERAVGGGDLVEEDDAAARRVAGPVARDEPLHAVRAGDGQAADVDRLALGEAHVDEADAGLARGVAQDRGLAEPGRAPDHERRQLRRPLGILRQRVELEVHQPAQLRGGDAVVGVEGGGHRVQVRGWRLKGMGGKVGNQMQYTRAVR